MPRILGIDYGMKKCGIAVTDSLQIIVSPLETIATSNLLSYIDIYIKSENVEMIVMGEPKHKDGTATYLREHIDIFIKKILKLHPNLEFDFQDERMTSIEAKNIILQSGIRKSKRRDKELIDKVSAVLILQRYLGHY